MVVTSKILLSLFVFLIISIDALPISPISSHLLPRRATDTSFDETKLKKELVVEAKSESPSFLRVMAPTLASAFCAAAIMYPLDLIRALQMGNAGSAKISTMKLLSNFRQQYGVRGFFTQGLVPAVALSTWMRFVKFSLFPLAHLSLTGISEKQGTGMTRAWAAIVSSVPEAMSIMPLEIAKICLQLDATNRFSNNMFKAMGAVYKEKGLQGFTVGYVGLQYRQAAWSAGYFASIKFFEGVVNKGFEAVAGDKFSVKDNRAAQVTSQLISGFLAGVFGACINTPGDTLRTILQKRVLSSGAGATTLLGVAKEVVGARGPGALYAGFKYKALHLGGGGALMAFLIPFFNNLFSKL